MRRRAAKVDDNQRTFEVKFHPRTWGIAYRPGTPGLFPSHLRIGCFTFSFFNEAACNNKERMT